MRGDAAAREPHGEAGQPEVGRDHHDPARAARRARGEARERDRREQGREEGDVDATPAHAAQHATLATTTKWHANAATVQAWNSSWKPNVRGAGSGRLSA